jgi:hypothetical protein
LSPPAFRLRIYHITHIDNLSSVAVCGSLWSDSECMRQDMAHTRVGVTAIKARRLYELEVDCHPGTKVGEYVPFYFCPRSIMLYLLHRGNHPDLNYTGGQRLIVHLAADLHEVVGWAEALRCSSERPTRRITRPTGKRVCAGKSNRAVCLCSTSIG